MASDRQVASSTSMTMFGERATPTLPLGASPQQIGIQNNYYGVAPSNPDQQHPLQMPIAPVTNNCERRRLIIEYYLPSVPKISLNNFFNQHLSRYIVDQVADS